MGTDLLEPEFRKTVQRTKLCYNSRSMEITKMLNSNVHCIGWTKIADHCSVLLCVNRFVLWCARADVLSRIHDQHPHLAVAHYDEVHTCCV